MRKLFFNGTLAIALALGLATSLAAQDSTKLARVRGRIVDLVGHGVVSGATVQLASRTNPALVLSAESDSIGAFEIDRVPFGDYLAGFFHPAVEDLGVRIPPTIVHVTASDMTLPLSTPTSAAVLAATCGAVADSSGLVIGRLIDAESEAPIADASVTVSWIDVVIDHGLKQARHSLTAKTTDQGMFGVCSVPTQGEITVVATSDAVKGGNFEASLQNDRVLRLRIGLSTMNTVVASGDSLAAGLLHGKATLHGRIVGDSALAPVAHASVTVRGSGIASTTDSDGRFVLTGLPSGTFTLDVRAIGYPPHAQPVMLRANADTAADVRLGSRATVLDAVQVFGEAPSASGFMQRMKRGVGRFLTPADVQRFSPYDLNDLLRHIPSIQLLYSPDGQVIRYRGGIALDGTQGGCVPNIYLNGMKTIADEDITFLAQPRSVTGIEVYSAGQEPAQFFAGGCASIVIWTGMMPK